MRIVALIEVMIFYSHENLKINDSNLKRQIENDFVCAMKIVCIKGISILTLNSLGTLFFMAKMVPLLLSGLYHIEHSCP